MLFWALVPIVVILGALWLAMGLRRLVQTRLDHAVAPLGATQRVYEESVKLQRALSDFEATNPDEPIRPMGDR